MDSPRVYVVILNWNQYDDTKECLDSLAKINYPNYRIVLVDNGSVDGSGNRLQKEFPDHVFIFNEENLGFAEGNNIGIKKALEDSACAYVLCLNNDTVVERGFLSELIMAAERNGHEHFGSFQAKMINYSEGSLMDSAGIVFSRIGFGFNRCSSTDQSTCDRNEEIFGCCAGAAMYRRSAVDDVVYRDSSFFDPRFFIYAEDVDVSFRLQLRGWRSFYVAGSVVLHKGSRAFGKKSSRSFILGWRNTVFYLAKNLSSNFIVKNIFLIVGSRCWFVLREGLSGNLSVAGVFIKAHWLGFLRWGEMRRFYQKIRTEDGFDGNKKRMEKLFVLNWRTGGRAKH